MRERHLVRFEAILFLVLAVVLVGLAFLAAGNGPGRLIVLAGAVVVAGRGWWGLREARETPIEDRVGMPPVGATLRVQLDYYRRSVRIALFGFVAMTVMAGEDLLHLRAEEGRGMFPIDFTETVYDHLGFWPALLIVPVGGVLTVAALRVKMRGIRREIESVARAGQAEPEGMGRG